MANTYVKIASVAVGAGGAASIDFSSIPATYTDLVVKVSARDSSGSLQDSVVKFNGSSTGYSYKVLYGTGSAAGSNGNASATVGIAGNIPSSSQTASTFSNAEIYIPNYTSANNKSMSVDAVGETNATAVFAYLVANLWSNTAAINQITLTTVNSFVQYSTAVLYGIKSS